MYSGSSGTGSGAACASAGGASGGSTLGSPSACPAGSRAHGVTKTASSASFFHLLSRGCRCTARISCTVPLAKTWWMTPPHLRPSQTPSDQRASRTTFMSLDGRCFQWSTSPNSSPSSRTGRPKRRSYPVLPSTPTMYLEMRSPTCSTSQAITGWFEGNLAPILRSKAARCTRNIPLKIFTPPSMPPLLWLSFTGVGIGVAPSGSAAVTALRSATSAGSPSERMSTRPR